MSSASSSTSKRVRQAIAGSDVSENPPKPAPTETESQANSESSSEVSSESTENATPRQSRRGAKRAGSRSALTLQRHRSHSMDNRPVDPSPIQVSHTVAMGGQRPIGVSKGQRGPNFSGAQTILNRPIAPNTTAQDDEMLGYLD